MSKTKFTDVTQFNTPDYTGQGVIPFGRSDMSINLDKSDDDYNYYTLSIDGEYNGKDIIDMLANYDNNLANFVVLTFILEHLAKEAVVSKNFNKLLIRALKSFKIDDELKGTDIDNHTRLVINAIIKDIQKGVFGAS